MQFTYEAYIQLLKTIEENGYSFCNYENYLRDEECVILRHDIDYSLEQAVKLARIEHEHGVSSTYFVLLSSDFYNPASSSSYRYLHEIIRMGHHVGLHFDETAYAYDGYKLEYYIRKEARILSDLLDVNINSFSLHRPNQKTIETELSIPGLVNSYGNEFFLGFKYLSDSRRRWREPVDEIIRSKAYKRLHILTHAFWYHETDQAIEQTITEFIRNAGTDRTRCLQENITALDEIIGTAGTQGDTRRKTE